MIQLILALLLVAVVIAYGLHIAAILVGTAVAILAPVVALTLLVAGAARLFDIA